MATKKPIDSNRSSAPSKDVLRTNDVVVKQARAADKPVAAMPHNELKKFEYGHDNALAPRAGARVELSPTLTASTASEVNATEKTGGLANASLARHKVDGNGQTLSTNQGVPVSDNQNSLKAGLKGPSLLEDFILREKITHFDHERIPERIVHARGSGAHGYFESFDDLSKLTRAAPFSAAGKITPVFVRFSTVAGERGSKDTARDVRGFAVKFYSDEGNWDLVGNNMPVFFIQDAMKFPDLVHAVKPEPHNGMPQAASAHDTFWDFVSLMPESTHMLLWVMSDRAIPRSYRMMQGFGVHTFRLINAAGESIFCKFHWKPAFGTHSLLWDEAVKISGADPDFHRRDLWEAIESGDYPEWELGLQVFTEAQGDAFSFDILDATKLIPEELVPVIPVGRLVLNRNPDNFFAETEQVAFCAAHVIPGIDFSNDPLLAGRIHSYIDTQITRLGGPNFHEIPINTPIAPVNNHQRDGMHRQAVHRGRVAYEPNSLGGGCPFQAGQAGFQSFPQPVIEDKVRGKPEKFAEHYAQATLFFESQMPLEKAHIIGAFRFELSKVNVPAIRERMLASLLNVSVELAEGIAAGLGVLTPAAMPRAHTATISPEIKHSPALSLSALPGQAGARTRQIAFLVTDGVHGASLSAVHEAISAAGAVGHFVGQRIGKFTTREGGVIEANKSLENSPSVLFDALVLPDGDEQALQTLLRDPDTLEHLKEQYRHGKTILAIGASGQLLELAGIPTSSIKDPGILLTQADRTTETISSFISAISAHRHHSRHCELPTA